MQFAEVKILDIQSTTFNQSLVSKGIKLFETSLPIKAVLARTFVNMCTHRGKALSPPYLPVTVRSRNYVLCVKPISIGLTEIHF